VVPGCRLRRQMLWRQMLGRQLGLLLLLLLAGPEH
jgi:hypothetical protein